MAFVGLANTILNTSGVVSYWPCDESSGNTLRDVVGGKTLTGVNSPTTGVSGKINKAVSVLAGSSQYYAITDGILGSTAPSEWWMFGITRGPSQDQRFPFGAAKASSGSGAFIGVGSGAGAGNTTKGRGYHWDDAINTWNPTGTNAIYDDADWHDVFIARKSGTNYYYEDGVLVSSSAFSAGTTTLEKFAIGALMRATPTLFWTGRVQHVACGVGALSNVATTAAALHAAAVALNAGTITVGTVTGSSVALSCTAAQQGTAPYTYQWYRDTTSGFTPGAGNLISGATSLSFTDSGLTPSTTYYYKLVVTDSAGTPATDVTLQVSATTGVAGTLHLIGAGNSHLAGWLQTTSVTALAGAILGWTTHNAAVAGQTLSQMITNIADVTSLSAPGTYTDGEVCLWTEAVNSIDAGDSPATVESKLVTYGGLLRAAGLKSVYLMPYPDLSTYTTTQERADLDAVCTWVRANWRSFADVLIDVRRDSRIGTAAAPNNSTYYNADKRHLSDTGAVIASQWCAAGAAEAIVAYAASGGAGLFVHGGMNGGLNG